MFNYLTLAWECQAARSFSKTTWSGELAVIVGKSGCRNSALINMLMGIDHPTRGEMWVNGTPARTLKEDAPARWRSYCVGIVFRFLQFLPALTAVKNLIPPLDFASC